MGLGFRVFNLEGQCIRPGFGLEVFRIGWASKIWGIFASCRNGGPFLGISI